MWADIGSRPTSQSAPSPAVSAAPGLAAADEAEHGEPAGHQAGSEHHPAEDAAVVDTDDKRRAQVEGPLLHD